jgi:hypothetical protein
MKTEMTYNEIMEKLDERLDFLHDLRWKLIEEMNIGGIRVDYPFKKSIMFLEDEIDTTNLKKTQLQLEQYDNEDN